MTNIIIILKKEEEAVELTLTARYQSFEMAQNVGKIAHFLSRLKQPIQIALRSIFGFSIANAPAKQNKSISKMKCKIVNNIE